MKEKIFNISELIQSPSALTTEQGEIIYNLMTPSLQHGVRVVLDFKDIESIITPFLNAAIGKLYEDYSSEQLQTLLQIKNIPLGTSSKFQIVINNAKQYYANKDKFNEAVQEVIDEL